LTTSDLDLGYSGAFLAWCTSLENSLESLFLGIVMKRYTHGPRVRPLVEIRSERVAQAVVRGGRKYVDWIPFDFTNDRAKAFLSAGLPFSELPNAQVRALERTFKIRNAIAHSSSHSSRVFKKEFVDGQNLPRWQHRPGGYLRGQHAGTQKRADVLIAEGLEAVTRLCQ
jgi:hypothetical protein